MAGVIWVANARKRWVFQEESTTSINTLNFELFLKRNTFNSINNRCLNKWKISLNCQMHPSYKNSVKTKK